MENTGIIRRIDDLGRLCIPKELRKSRNVNEGDELEFALEGDFIILHKPEVKERYNIGGNTKWHYIYLDDSKEYYKLTKDQFDLLQLIGVDFKEIDFQKIK